QAAAPPPSTTSTQNPPSSRPARRGYSWPPLPAWCMPPRRCCRTPPRRSRRCAISALRAAILHPLFPLAGKRVPLCPSSATAPLLAPDAPLPSSIPRHTWPPVFCALPQTVRANNRLWVSASLPLDFLKHYTSTARSGAGVSRCQNAASLTIVEPDATESLYARPIASRTEIPDRRVECPP